MALKYFMSSHLLSHQQVAWAQFLSWFHFKIEYAPGKGDQANTLSYQPDYVGALSETREVVLLPEVHFVNVAVSLSAPSFLECMWHLAPLPDLKDGWYMQDGLLHDAGERITIG
jgi:hypothetical protein